MAQKYESIQAILEEAGLSHQELAETPFGTTDGINRQFTTSQKPLSDSNYDDMVDANDVLVLVNGNPTEVEAVDAARGIITLKNAPADGDTVNIDYRYSSISVNTAIQRRTEAQQWVNDTMKKAGDCVPYEYDFTNEDKQPHPTIRAIVRYYAAAQLLIRDYGYNQDTEDTSKDGFKKLEIVIGSKKEPGMLEKFIETGGVCGNTGPQNASEGIETSSDGDLFAADLHDLDRRERRRNEDIY